MVVVTFGVFVCESGVVMVVPCAHDVPRPLG